MPREPIVMADVKAATDRLFNTRDGQAVLSYLMTRYYDSQIRDASIHRDVGRRDVLHHIKQLMRED